MALLALEEKLLGASVEVLMADEVFYELATVANAQGSLELTDAAYEKAEKLKYELAEREEREEELLEQVVRNHSCLNKFTKKRTPPRLKNALATLRVSGRVMRTTL